MKVKANADSNECDNCNKNVNDLDYEIPASTESTILADEERCSRIGYDFHQRDEELPNRYTIDLTPRNTLLGSLPNRLEIIVLIDSGATESIVSQDFVDKSMNGIKIEYEYFEQPIKLSVANGDFIFAEKKVKIPIRFGRLRIELRALVVPNDLGGIDVIFGSYDLAKYEARLDFTNNRISFAKGHDTIMRVLSEAYVPAQSSKSVRIYGKVPKIFQNKPMILKAVGFGKNILPERSLVDLKNGYCDVILLNNTDKRIKINNHARLARIDVETSFLKRDPAKLCNDNSQTSDRCFRISGDDYEISPDCEEFYTRMTRRELREYNTERYPFLDPSDPRMTKKPL